MCSFPLNQWETQYVFEKLCLLSFAEPAMLWLHERPTEVCGSHGLPGKVKSLPVSVKLWGISQSHPREQSLSAVYNEIGSHIQNISSKMLLFLHNWFYATSSAINLKLSTKVRITIITFFSISSLRYSWSPFLSQSTWNSKPFASLKSTSNTDFWFVFRHPQGH